MEGAPDNVTFLMVGYIILYVATLLVNKFVLSVLNFTFPTIFQGWQMLAGALLLQALSLQRKINITPALFNTERIAVAKWMPAVFFHVISIYCGSVALSRLPIPIFVVCDTFVSAVDNIHEGLKKHHSWRSWQNISIQLLLLATIGMVVWNDPEDHNYGYTWLLLHLLATGAYVLFEKIEGYSIKLGSLERLYCNFVFSAVVLAPFTYLLGDVIAAQEFQFFSFYRFYIGCLSSGLFGASWAVISIWLKETPGLTVTVGQIQALSKLLVVLMSLFLFEITFHASHAFWLLANLLLLIICEVPFKEVEISEVDQHET